MFKHMTRNCLPVASLLALANRGVPSLHWWKGSNAKELTHFACPANGLPTALPVSGHHSRTVLSMLPVANLLPSALQLSANTQPVWPLSVYFGVPVSVSHIRADYGVSPREINGECQSEGGRGALVPVLSPEPVAKRLLFLGENCAASIASP